MNKNRRINLNKNFTPLPNDVGDEIYLNGIFNFNISRILEHIALGKLKAEEEQINSMAQEIMADWYVEEDEVEEDLH